MKNDLAAVLASMLGKIPGVVLKLPPETVKALLKTRSASLLVMGKRTMKEWVVIRYKESADAKKHLTLFKEAMDYVSSKA